MTKDLFLEGIEFHDKVASVAMLGSNPAKWGPEIMSTALARLPFLDKYGIRIVLDKIKPEHGSATGWISVESKGASKKTAKILLIAADRQLKPLDILMLDDDFYPLTERRLHSYMFDPGNIEVSDKSDKAVSLVNMITPPSTMEFGKYSSLLALASSASSEGDVNEFKIAMNDPAVKQAYLDGPLGGAVHLMTDMLVGIPDGAMLKKVASAIRPTVIDTERTEDGYRIKQAHHALYRVDEMYAGVPTDPLHIIKTGLRTLNPLASAHVVPNDPTPLSKDAAAIIHTEAGALHGCYVPERVTIEGANEGEPIFLSKTGAYAEGDFPAYMDSGVANIAVSPSEGEGVFVFNRGGNVYATEKVACTPDPSIVMYDGEPMAMQKVATYMPHVHDGVMFMPEDASFVSTSTPVAPMGAPDVDPDSTIKVSCANGAYSVEGTPVDRIPYNERVFVTEKQASFVMAMAGLPLPTIDDVMKSANTDAVRIAGCRIVNSFDDVATDGIKEAAWVMQESGKYLDGLMLDYIKEASTMPDGPTVDTLLAMNFLSPANMSIFVGYIPTLEQAVKNIASLTVANRLGMKQVPGEALERCLMHLEQIVQALKDMKESNQ